MLLAYCTIDNYLNTTEQAIALTNNLGLIKHLPFILKHCVKILFEIYKCSNSVTTSNVLKTNIVNKHIFSCKFDALNKLYLHCFRSYFGYKQILEN